MASRSKNFANLNRQSPVNWAHPLNRGRLAWWLTAPGFSDGFTWFNLCRTKGSGDATLIGMANSSNGWRGSSQVGGFKSLLCDGSAGYANAAGASTSGAFTLACWVQVITPAAFHYAICFNGSFVGFRFPSGTTASMCDGAQDVGTVAIGSNWARLVGVLDGTHDTLYVNGVVSAQAASAVVGFSGLGFGARGDTGGVPLNCLLNDIGLWSRGLSAAEVVEDYSLSRRAYPGVLNRVRQRPFFSTSAPAVSGLLLRRRRMGMMA